MFPEFTNNDLLILEKHRLERFRSFFPDTLPLCYLSLNSHNTLTVHCPEPWQVDQLLYEIEQLCWYAWIVVGAHRISIYFAQEEIHKTKTHKLSKRTQKARLKG
jgi:hypothetical protein